MLRNRKNRLGFSRAFFGIFGVPQHALRFNVPDEPTPGGGGGGDPEPEPETVPKSQLTEAIKRRDKAIRERNKAIAEKTQALEALGIDPADCETAGTGTESDPFRIGNLEELIGEVGGKKKPVAADKKTAKQLDRAQKENAALREFIAREHITGEIRRAAAENGAHNGDKGAYKTIVKLVKPLYTPAVEFDAESGSVSVTMIGKDDETGEPLTDANGDPLPISATVKRVLQENKTLISSTLRGGPGAGGARDQQQRGIPADTPDAVDKKIEDAVDAIFPMNPVLRH